VTAHPLPADLVPCRGCIEPLPEIDVLDRLLVGGAPTPLLPAMYPFGDAVTQILAVAVEPTRHGRFSASSPDIAAIISMRLLVVSGS